MNFAEKNYSYANRGTDFENIIRNSNEWYRRNGIAVIMKIPTEFVPLRDRYGRVYSVKVTHKATVDFIGRVYDKPIMVEAKHTGSGSIRLDAVQPNQVQDLDEFTAGGGLGLVVVSFSFRDFFAVPWEWWTVAYNLRICQKSKEEHICMGVSVPIRMSLKPEDLEPFRVYSKSYMTIDYLEVLYGKQKSFCDEEGRP